MKKFFVLSLVLVLLFALTLPAFAARETITSSSGSNTSNVTATYVAGAASATVYSIDVEFGAMSFTYTDESEGTWDPVNHVFKDKDGATWGNNTSADIKVTNHSNTAVSVRVSYAKASGYTGSVDADISNGSFKLATAVGTQPSAAPTNTAKLTIKGVASKEDNTLVGKVTVSIAKAD